jgi:hypothetical protein
MSAQMRSFVSAPAPIGGVDAGRSRVYGNRKGAISLDPAGLYNRFSNSFAPQAVAEGRPGGSPLKPCSNVPAGGGGNRFFS